MIDKEIVSYIIDKLQERDLSPGTINSYLSAIKGVAYHCLDRDKITGEQYAKIKAIKKPKGTRLKKEGKFVTKKQLIALLDSCNRDSNRAKGLRDSAIIVTMRGCGLRRSEAVSLTRSSIDFKAMKLTVIGKNNKERRVWFNESVKTHLEAWLGFINEIDGIDKEYLFLATHATGVALNKGMSSQTIYDLLRDRQVETGVDKFSPHDIRRTYITSLLDEGVPVENVQAMVGHESTETTRIYDLNKERGLKEIGRSIEFL